MKITQEEVVDRQTVLQIELEDEDLDTYLNMGYRKVVPRASIPGFRKGKAPRRIIEQYLGREVLLNEVLDTMLPEVTGKAIDAQEIEAAGLPRIELMEFDPITVKATVPLIPEIELGDYRDSLRVEQEETEVNEDGVQDRLEQLQHSQATWEPVERPVELGDLVTITAVGEVEGTNIINETDIEYFLDEDSQRPLPGFPQSLVGMSDEETKEFTLSIPDDFNDPNFAGKEAQFNVTVSGVKERNLPEFDDEFAQSVGDGYESMDALREEIENDVKEQAENEANQKYRDAVVEAFLEGVTVDVAPVMVDHEIDHMEEERDRFLQQVNIRIEDYLTSIGKTYDEMRNELKEEAEGRIKRTFALSKLAEEEGIEVSEEEVEDRIQSILSQNAEQNEGAEDPEITDEMRDTIDRMLRSEKTLDLLVAIAKDEAPAQAEASKEEDEEESEDQTEDSEAEEEAEESEKDE